MNRVNLIGRISQDLEIKTFKETKVLKFGLAVRRDKEKTDFINITCFNKTAETIEKYFKKGCMIGIDGKIATGSYEKDGKKVYTFEVNVDGFFFCESAKSNDSEPTKQNTSNRKTTNQTEINLGSDDDLPF